MLMSHTNTKARKLDAYVIFCKILQRALPLWEHESSAEELPVVPPSLHQHAVPNPCREPAQLPMRQNTQTFILWVFVGVRSPSSYAKFFVGSENSFLSYFALIHCSLNTLNTESRGSAKGNEGEGLYKAWVSWDWSQGEIHNKVTCLHFSPWHLQTHIYSFYIKK